MRTACACKATFSEGRKQNHNMKTISLEVCAHTTHSVRMAKTSTPPKPKGRKATNLLIEEGLKTAGAEYVSDCLQGRDRSIRSLSDLVNQLLAKKLKRA